jgi:hypothetical protein
MLDEMSFPFSPFNSINHELPLLALQFRLPNYNIHLLAPPVLLHTHQIIRLVVSQ